DGEDTAGPDERGTALQPGGALGPRQEALVGGLGHAGETAEEGQLLAGLHPRRELLNGGPGPAGPPPGGGGGGPTAAGQAGGGGGAGGGEEVLQGGAAEQVDVAGREVLGGDPHRLGEHGERDGIPVATETGKTFRVHLGERAVALVLLVELSLAAEGVDEPRG